MRGDRAATAASENPDMTPPDAPWRLSPEALARRFAVDAETGLSAAAVRRRRRRVGANRLPAARRRSTWAILRDQFKSLVVALLAVAAVTAAVFGQFVEAAAVAAALLINALIGFVTELRATRSMDALRRMGQTRCRVRRAGRITEVAADHLVPGDVVLLAEGDIVPADLRLIDANALQVDESALTGESEPVMKEAAPLDTPAPPLAEIANMAFRGTAVTGGEATALVIATGAATEVGRIAHMAEAAGAEVTPLERRLDSLGKRLVWLVLAVAVLVSATGILAGRDLFLMIETGIALAVAAVPEGLPIVATVALAHGMRRMARRNALVKQLSAVETLGATTTILTDKTGTLTENRMTLRRLALSDTEIDIGRDESVETHGKSGSAASSDDRTRRALAVGALCSDAILADGARQGESHGDPTELALLRAAQRAGLDRPSLIEDLPEVRQESFSPETRMMATVHRQAEGYHVAVKGAPEAVLQAATQAAGPDGPLPLDSAARTRWTEAAERMAGEGLRVLALAEKTVDDLEAPPYTELLLLGLAGLHDPPRESVREAVAACQAAGIRVAMVTGDKSATAASIARRIGLGGGNARALHVLSGPTADDDPEAVRRADVFARVSPSEKLRLVEIHQDAGAIVGMTGDGVNDAPALKKADIGIAMGGRGTEVAREAGDIVLKDDRFETIVSAISYGRTIFDNIRRFIVFLLSGNLGEVLAVALAALANLPLPLLPLQILFINLLLDVFPALALGLGPGSEAVMRRPPRPPGEPLLTRGRWLAVGAYGTVIAAAVLAVFGIALAWLDFDTATAVSVSFLTFGFARLAHVFNMRAPGSRLLHNDVTGNPFVWAAMAICAVLLVAAAYLPGLADLLSVQDPGLTGWGLIAAGSLTPLLVGQASLALIAARRKA